MSGKDLFWNYVKHETNQLYLDGYNHLVKKGFIVLGIVCDGRKGLFQLFGKTPVQMCQFHQVAIVTRNPKTIAGKELRINCLLLVRTDRESFAGGLESWYSRWKDYLNERTLDKNTGKSRFTHKKILFKKVCKAQKFTIFESANLKSIYHEIYTTASK